MNKMDTRARYAILAALAACGASVAQPVAAQDAGVPPAARPVVSRAAPPSPNATINLINLLVKQNVLTEEQAKALIKQADEEAYVARQAVKEATTKAETAKTEAQTAIDATSPPGTKRVTYVPEIVKKQIREELRVEVMEKAKVERWAAPGTFPEWVSRIRWSGDFRARYEGIFYPEGNVPIALVNYNAINTTTPYDVNLGNTNNFLWPSYNADQDRNRGRLRARVGMEALLFDGFTTGIRIATGDTNAPITFNQTLGGSGGNFSKYNIWLDRAYINYRPFDELSLSAGRFDNPFFHPTDLVWHRDLGFDGIAMQGKYEVYPGIVPFLVAGAFPIFNTALDARSNRFISTTSFGTSQPSHDKWMWGIQGGSAFRAAPEIEFRFGAAYYNFVNVRGLASTPCIATDVRDICDTDLTRPSFAQKGNTYMALRQINPAVAGNAFPEFQYFGLAADFQNVVLTGRADFSYFAPVHVVLDGEYVRNVAWNRDEVAARICSNRIPAGPATDLRPVGEACRNAYSGGDTGWLGRMTVGHPTLKEFADWNFFVGYKYLESDAVIDAFADSDFGLGGTNLKGYFVGANFGLGRNFWATARWLSANQVAGYPYAVDILQIDLNARF